MFKKGEEKSAGLLILGIVAVVALVGLVLLFKGGATGAFTKGGGGGPGICAALPTACPSPDEMQCFAQACTGAGGHPAPVSETGPACVQGRVPVYCKYPAAPGPTPAAQTTGAAMTEPPRVQNCGCTPVNNGGICNIIHPSGPYSRQPCLQCNVGSQDLHVGGC